MQIPNGFMQSSATKTTEYDQEGRLRLTRYGHGGEGGVGESNSIYATDAELFGTCAPFLKANRMKDAKRRNYIIQSGGALILFEEGEQPEDQRQKLRFSGPADQTSFGHTTVMGEGNKLARRGER